MEIIIELATAAQGSKFGLWLWFPFLLALCVSQILYGHHNETALQWNYVKIYTSPLWNRDSFFSPQVYRPDVRNPRILRSRANIILIVRHNCWLCEPIWLFGPNVWGRRFDPAMELPFLFCVLTMFAFISFGRLKCYSYFVFCPIVAMK